MNNSELLLLKGDISVSLNASVKSYYDREKEIYGSNIGVLREHF
jgi:hypothetical protein